MNKYIELIDRIEISSIVKDLPTKELNLSFDNGSGEEIKSEVAKLINLFWINYDLIVPNR